MTSRTEPQPAPSVLPLPPPSSAGRLARTRLRATAILLLAVSGIATSSAGCGPGRAPGSAGTTAASVPAERTGSAGPGLLDAALLPPTWLGSGWREGPTPPEKPPWPWLQADCPGYRNEDYPAQGHRRDAVQRRFQQGQTNLIATHVVEAYEPGWAARAVTDVRRVVETCPEYPILGGALSFAVVGADFPAEDTLLVRGRIESSGAPDRVMLFVTVRRGDLLSTLSFPEPADERAAYAAAAKLGDLLG
ncbi:hypothetical protein I0C86_18080 [Plantactinospora sp. S1510]|uniref:Sensor domain-containing protein n=1 Tax=Plantactinospora alkalitolerans TaxID=2789879 RepID=A0ABS0GXB7_9ACTN|nr:hypothetical protein [Plantactinospora alkalitolerans]MBF9130852.1 hypothetical protein [Plantactinospora alkalitolerans]